MAVKEFTRIEIPNGNDTIVFEGLTKDNLIEVDLSDYPVRAEFEEAIKNIEDGDFVRRDELKELDLSNVPTQTDSEEFFEKIDTDQYATYKDLTELDLSNFASDESIREFNATINGNYLERTDISTIDSSDFISRSEFEALVARLEQLERAVNG